MAIDLKQSYIQKAVRLSLYGVAATVKDVHPGQLFQLNDDGLWEYADGTRKAYPTLNSRYPGTGLGLQGELMEGRDDVSRANMLACLKGNFELSTTMFDPDATYISGHPLHPSTDPNKKGLMTMYDPTNAQVGS